MSKRVRLDADSRRAVIIATGVRLANEHGLWKCTKANVARECDPPLTHSGMVYYFPLNIDLKKAVVATGELNERARTQAADAGLL
jgi:DNA-binding transcriptional regulator YbjK